MAEKNKRKAPEAPVSIKANTQSRVVNTAPAAAGGGLVGWVSGQLDEVKAGRDKDSNVNAIKKYFPDSPHRSGSHLITPNTQPGVRPKAAAPASAAPYVGGLDHANGLPQPAVVSVDVPVREVGPTSFQPPPPVEIKASNAPPAAHVARAGNPNPVASNAPAAAPRLAAAPRVTGPADSSYDATRSGAGEVRGNQFFDRLHRSVDKAVFGGTAKSQNATYKYDGGDNRSDKD